MAADSEAICEVITKAGGRVVLTGEAHSGTDRTALAAEIVDYLGKHQVVINQQGDMPFINPTHLWRGPKILSTWQLMYVNWGSSTCAARISSAPPSSRVSGFTLSHGTHCANFTPCRRVDARLEQLRAVGQLAITFIELAHMPQEVNTPEDLEAANAMVKAAGSSL